MKMVAAGSLQVGLVDFEDTMLPKIRRGRDAGDSGLA